MSSLCLVSLRFPVIVFNPVVGVLVATFAAQDEGVEYLGVGMGVSYSWLIVCCMYLYVGPVGIGCCRG